MSSLQQPLPITVEQYLEGERLAEVKHEYLGGEVHAMAGATNRHNEIALSFAATFRSVLRGKPCSAFNSDTKVRIDLGNHIRFYYPDAMVVYQKNKNSDHWQDRPVVVVEVLSESTRRIDLTEKREAYFAIPTLRVLIFAEPDQPALVVHRRDGEGFAREEHTGLDAVVPLPEIESALPLAEVYEGIEF